MINKIKNQYYQYIPGEFLPIYSGSELLNKREFHKYRITYLLRNVKPIYRSMTHSRG